MTNPGGPPPEPTPAPLDGGGGGKKFDLAKQYGPLPLGAWIILVGGALGIAWYTNKKNKAAQPVGIVEDTSGAGGVGTGGVSQWVQNNPPPEEVAPVPTNNVEWARKAINWLIAQGYDASMADTAIRKYLESTPLSLSENALVKSALMKLGSPPEPLPTPPDLPTPPAPAPAPSSPPPAPPPAPAPAPQSQRWVTVTPWPTRFSTLWGIATWAYGSGAQWPRLFNANQVGTRRPDGSSGMIKNPNLIYAGWRIYVP